MEELIQHMCAPMKMQVERLQKPESGFTADKILHLYLNVYRLTLP